MHSQFEMNQYSQTVKPHFANCKLQAEIRRYMDMTSALDKQQSDERLFDLLTKSITLVNTLNPACSGFFYRRSQIIATVGDKKIDILAPTTCSLQRSAGEKSSYPGVT
jgi:hypothetical protein